MTPPVVADATATPSTMRSPLAPRDTNQRIVADGDVEFAWELSKENVQPLKRGRDARALSSALSSAATGMSASAGGDAVEEEKRTRWARALS